MKTRILLVVVSISAVLLWYLFFQINEENSSETEIGKVYQQTYTEDPNDKSKLPNKVSKLPLDNEKKMVVCKDVIQPYVLNEEWQQDNQSKLLDLFDSYLKDGISGITLEYVAHELKITTMDLKELLGVYNSTNKKLPLLAGHGSTQVDFDTSFLMTEAFESENLASIVDIYTSNKFTGSEYFVTLKGQYSLVAAILRQGLNSNETYKLISNLIDRGYKATLLDLIVATEQSIPTQLATILIQNSKVDPSFTFDLRGSTTSLPRIAQNNLDVNMLDFWLSIGSSAYTEPGQGNLMDELAHSYSSDKHDLFVEVYLVLKKHLVHATKKSSENKLYKWLPSTEIEQYKNNITRFSAEKERFDARIQRISSEIRDIIMAPMLTKGYIASDTDFCFVVTADSVFQNIFDTSKTSDLLSVETEAKVSVEEVSPLKPKHITNAFEKYKTQLEFHETLKGDSSLSSKLDILELEKAAILEIRSESRESTIDNAGTNDEALLELLRNKKWQQIVTLLSENKHSEGIGKIVLSSAIDEFVEENTIFGMIPYVNFNDFIILNAVVQSGRVPLLTKLMASGLDINLRSQMGRNAIYVAANSVQLNMLDFLINKGVSLESTKMGLDALDISLMKLQFSNDLSIVEKLIDAYISIEKSHKELTKKLMEQGQAETYWKLVSKYPKLKLD